MDLFTFELLEHKFHGLRHFLEELQESILNKLKEIKTQMVNDQAALDTAIQGLQGIITNEDQSILALITAVNDVVAALKGGTPVANLKAEIDSIAAMGTDVQNQVAGIQAAVAAAQGALPPPAAPIVNSPATAIGIVGSPFTYQITATGKPNAFAAIGLPDGLVIDTVAGLITGTPTAAGATDVQLTATNAVGTSAPFTLSISVS